MSELEKKAEAIRVAEAIKKMEDGKRQLALAYGRGLDDGAAMAMKAMQAQEAREARA